MFIDAGAVSGLTACSTSSSTGRGTYGNLFEGLFSGTSGDRFRVSLNPVRFVEVEIRRNDLRSGE